jgi:hypothetical protein
MARITYADRFNDLLAKDYLTDNDRRFAESLYTYYKRKKVLTAGRRRCFLNLEQRYAERPVTNDAVVARINGLCERMDAAPGSEWESNFAISLLQQAKAGRDLSERQFEILEKIESKWSDDALQARNDWADNFTSEMAEKYRVMMEYYGKSGYYSNLTTAYKKDPSLIPTMENYQRITDNKYAAKVLTAWLKEPAYPPGSMVALRSGASYRLMRAFERSMGIVVSVNDSAPVSAARGSKIYRVLPVGSAQTVICEERHLKTVRSRKKK